MADKRLAFRISADDEASKVFSKLSSNAKSELGKVDDSLDDSKTKAERVAAALGSVFDDLDADLAGTKEAADRLAQALGPELAAKVDTTALVGEFRKLGLSIEDVKAEADTLAAAVRKADDVTLRHFTGEADRASGSLDRVRDSADQSRSVLANTVGNSVQDLAGLGGVAGTAGVALGQLGEYAAEGNISLRNLAAVAGPMALVGLAVAGVSGHLKEQARIKAFNRDQVDSWAEAIRTSGDAVQTMIDKFREAGEIKFLDILGDEQDLTPKLAAAGVSVEQWTQLVTGSREELDAWAVASKDAGADIDALKVVVLAAQQEQERYRKGQQQAAIQADVFGESTEAAAASVERIKARFDEARTASQRYNDEVRRGTESAFDYEAATLRLAEGVRSYGQAAAEGEQSSEALRLEEIALAEQALAAAQAFARQQGAQAGSAAEAEMMRQALLRMRDQFPILREEIDSYIAMLNRIPTSRTTNLIVRQSTTTASGAPARNFVRPEERAEGGPVRAGEPYLVGEDGPEVIVPNSNGAVIPNGAGVGTLAGGGGGNVIVYLTAHLAAGTNPVEHGRQIANWLTAYLRTGGAGQIRRELGITA